MVSSTIPSAACPSHSETHRFRIICARYPIKFRRSICRSSSRRPTVRRWSLPSSSLRRRSAWSRSPRCSSNANSSANCVDARSVGMSQSWIDIHDLRLERGGRLVLQGVNASLAGRAVGLVGANGAGKSTLIGALLGVLKPSSGSIRVLDLEIPARAMDLRARAGVMAEQAGVFPGGSGVDAVVFAGMLSGLSRRESLRRSHRALDALDVGEERYRPASGYSTGMKQRTKLAMSLVHDPEILILDEPTVGLD